MPNTAKPTVMLLFGGQSSEHEISCATAAGVMEAIDTDRWNVIPVGITKDGQWVPQPFEPARYQLSDTSGYEVKAAGQQVSLLTGPNGDGAARLAHFEVDQNGDPVPGTLTSGPAVDVVFPLLHGSYGEDGTVQGLLELAPVNYVGCGVAASATAMDKRLTKTVLEQNGLPTGKWVGISPLLWKNEPDRVLQSIANLGMPVFVKPCRAGSSLGISKVDRAADLPAAIEDAAEHDPQIIVEAANPGRELECAILQLPGGELVASPLGEIVVEGADFYDYDTKYFAPERTTITCPVDLPGGHQEDLQRAAKQAFAALGCEGLARVDFFYQPETGEYIINEVNTLPGFTPYSMYPKAMEQAGITYPQLVQTLLEEAASRPRGLR